MQQTVDWFFEMLQRPNVRGSSELLADFAEIAAERLPAEEARLVVHAVMTEMLRNFATEDWRRLLVERVLDAYCATEEWGTPGRVETEDAA